MDITSEDLYELLSCIDSLVGMMEPYYSQCGGADEANEILDKYRKKQPHTTEELIPARCKICNKTFEISRKKNRLTGSQQDAALTNHLISEHKIVEHKERNKFKIKSKIVITHWATYQEYLDNS